jgi:prevent-host-death family protein
MIWSGQTMYPNGRLETMQIANISEAKAQLSALIEKVLAGEEVIIGKAGKPIVRLVKFESSRQPRQPGALRGKIKISQDFDELPDDLAKAFGMVQE